MTYCPHGGRIVNEGDIFCANCGRRLFLEMSSETPSPLRGRWVSCPRCHGTMFIDDPESRGKGAREVQEQRQGTGKIRCNYSECRNGKVWISD